MNSRNKGNRNERVAAGELTKWTKRKFERTPSSGGLQWKASFSKGDVVCTKEGHVFPFCVEVKAHKEIDFSHLITPGIKNVKILDFWEQCRRDATACKKVPLLLMRYDNMPKAFFFVGLPESFYRKVHNTVQAKITLRYYDWVNNKFIVFIRSTDLFSASYSEIKQIAKSYLKTQM